MDQLIHHDCVVPLMEALFKEKVVIGNKYSLSGTGDIYEITSETDTHWVLKIKSSKGQQDDVFMSKRDLADSESQGQLIKI